MLGVPFGPWTAHVVQFRPIGVEQGLGQTLEELDDVEGKLRILALSGELATMVVARIMAAPAGLRALIV